MKHWCVAISKNWTKRASFSKKKICSF